MTLDLHSSSVLEKDLVLSGFVSSEQKLDKNNNKKKKTNVEGGSNGDAQRQIEPTSIIIDPSDYRSH